MKNILTYAIFFFFSFVNNCPGQYYFNNIKSSNDFDFSHIKTIEKDKFGFIWMGTKNGLFRFDGTDVIAFQHDPNDSTTISEDNILSLFCDSKGNIWAGTRDKGVNIIDPVTLKIKHIHVSDSRSSGLSSVQHKMIFEDNNGYIFISCSYTGFDVYDPRTQTLTNYKPVDQFTQLPPRKANCIISGTPDPFNPEFVWFGSLHGIFKFHLKSKKFYYYPITSDKSENPEFYCISEMTARDFLFLEENELWYGSWGGGICRLNTQTGTFRSFKYEEIEPVNGYRNNVNYIIKKSESELWFSAQYKSLGVLNIETGETHFITSYNNNDDAVLHPSDIIMTKEGQIFVSSYSEGLYFTHLNAHIFHKKYLPYKLISGTEGNNNDFWAGTYDKIGKLLHINLETSECKELNFQPKININDNYFVEIINADSCLWLIEHNNLFSLDFEKEKIEPRNVFQSSDLYYQTDRYPALQVASEDKSGNLWIGTKAHGIFCINHSDSNVESYFYPEPQINSIDFSEYIFSLFTDSKGRIWYGTANFGFFNPKNNKFTNFFYPEDFPESAVKLNKIYTINERNNQEIWLGTENDGIAVLKTVNDTLKYSASYTRKNGLSDNQVRNMITDKENNVWVTTAKGLSRIIPSTGSVENYNIQYGLEQIHFLSMLNDGRIFMGSNNGYYLFQPEKIKPAENSPNIYIKSFKVFDDEIPIHSLLYSDKPIHLKYDQNYFSVEFGIINFFKDLDVNFSYILEGFDEQWHYAGKRTYLSYTNVKGGNYILKIKSAYGNEISMSILVDTPYWKTWWFYLLIILMIIGFGLLIHFYRMKQYRKQEELKTAYDKKISQLEMKALRSQMNPHFLFNSLNSIRYYILQEDHDNASEYITKFSRLLRLILNNSRQTQISLKDELHALQIYIDFEQMRFSNKFEYIINIAQNINSEEIKIPPLTIQPFVENAIWHGLMPKKENGMLTVGISKDKNTLKIIIEDNGIGRQKAREKVKSGLEETKSFGLQITEDRMNMMESLRGKRSDFKIVDLYENKKPTGTRVIITFEI